jgi:hypothetical protein
LHAVRIPKISDTLPIPSESCPTSTRTAVTHSNGLIRNASAAPGSPASSLTRPLSYVYRFVSALLTEISQDWETRKIYLNIAFPKLPTT